MITSLTLGGRCTYLAVVAHDRAERRTAVDERRRAPASTHHPDSAGSAARSAWGDVGVRRDMPGKRSIADGASHQDPTIAPFLNFCVTTGNEAATLEQLQRLVIAFEGLGDANDVDRTHRGIGEQNRIGMGRLVRGPGNGVAMRARPRITEHLDQTLFDLVGDHTLPALGRVVDLPPFQPDHVTQHPLGEAVATHGPVSQRTAVFAQRDGLAGGDDRPLLEEAVNRFLDVVRINR